MLCQNRLNAKSPNANSSRRGFEERAPPSEAREDEVGGALLIGNDEADRALFDIGFDIGDAPNPGWSAPAVNGDRDLLPPWLEAALTLVEVEHDAVLAERAADGLAKARAADADAVVPVELAAAILARIDV